MNQQLSIMKIEMLLDISINPGDKVTLIPDLDTRVAVMKSLFKPLDNIVEKLQPIDKWVAGRSHVTHGVVEFVSIGLYFSGPEIRIDGLFLPLPLVKTINGKEINF